MTELEDETADTIRSVLDDVDGSRELITAEIAQAVGNRCRNWEDGSVLPALAHQGDVCTLTGNTSLWVRGPTLWESRPQTNNLATWLTMSPTSITSATFSQVGTFTTWDKATIEHALFDIFIELGASTGCIVEIREGTKVLRTFLFSSGDVGQSLWNHADVRAIGNSTVYSVYARRHAGSGTCYVSGTAKGQS